MYRQCTTKEGVRRQQQLSRSLLNLMGTAPYSRITIGDICTQVGLSRKSFYRYFDCKEDCLNALLDHVLQDFTRFYPNADNTPRPNREFMEQYFTYWQKQRHLLDLLQKNQLISLIYERMILIVNQQLQTLRNHPEFDDIYEQYLFMICGTTSLILDWHISGYRKTPAQMAATVDRLIERNENER